MQCHWICVKNKPKKKVYNRASKKGREHQAMEKYAVIIGQKHENIS